MSSKFSRPFPVQQPPPVCKKGVVLSPNAGPFVDRAFAISWATNARHALSPQLDFQDGGTVNLANKISGGFGWQWRSLPDPQTVPNGWTWNLQLNISQTVERYNGSYKKNNSVILQIADQRDHTPFARPWSWAAMPIAPNNWTLSGQILFNTINY